jgi:hypothetical protein
VQRCILNKRQTPALFGVWITAFKQQNEDGLQLVIPDGDVKRR